MTFKDLKLNVLIARENKLREELGIKGPYIPQNLQHKFADINKELAELAGK